MLLLDDMAAVMANWVSAAIALAALIVSYFTYIQEKQIKELTGLVEELANQTKELKNHTDIMNKRFELESNVAIFNSIPVFKEFKKENARLLEYHGPADNPFHDSMIVEFEVSIVLVNIGLAASSVYPESVDDRWICNLDDIDISGIVDSNSYINLKITGKRNGKLDDIVEDDNEFEFWVNFRDRQSKSWRQELSYNIQIEYLHIGPPILHD